MICTNYLNDFLYVAVSRQVCNHYMQVFLDICSDIGCPVALDKTEEANDCMVFLGIMLNGKTMTLSIPED